MHIIKSLFFLFFLSGFSAYAQGNQNYLLSLSWSPTYCLTNSYAGKNSQCDTHNKYGFIVHGLWGQGKEDKKPPFFCDKQKREVSAQIIENIYSIMPSAGLIKHEWNKHGTCSDYSQKEYFNHIKTLYHEYNVKSFLQSDKEKLKTISSEALRQEIISKSNGLKDNEFMFTCSGRFIKEVRICLNNNLEPRKCTVPERKGQCRLKNIYVPYL